MSVRGLEVSGGSAHSAARGLMNRGGCPARSATSASPGHPRSPPPAHRNLQRAPSRSATTRCSRPRPTQATPGSPCWASPGSPPPGGHPPPTHPGRWPRCRKGAAAAPPRRTAGTSPPPSSLATPFTPAAVTLPPSPGLHSRARVPTVPGIMLPTRGRANRERPGTRRGEFPDGGRLEGGSGRGRRLPVRGRRAHVSARPSGPAPCLPNPVPQ